VAFSGASLQSCKQGQLSLALVKPYVQINLSGTNSGTYQSTFNCGTPGGTGNVFTATYDADGLSTMDLADGTVHVSANDPVLYISYDLTFTTGVGIDTPDAHLQGSMPVTAHGCQ
jgi:hypothetical protein